VLACALSALIVLAISGCGGGGSEGNEDKTFDGDGFSFQYPGDWVEGEFANPNSSVVAGVTYPGAEQGTTDSVSVAKGSVPEEVTKENLSEVVAAIKTEAAAAYDEVLEGPVGTEIGGRPAITLRAKDTSPEGDDVVIRAAVVIANTTRFVIQCEYLPENAEKITPGCDQVIETFKAE
jgi:hypothetical protein